MSALLTVTMPAMKSTIEALEIAGLRRQVKVLVGGAPVTMQYAKEIGADGYSENASGAVSLAKGLLKGA
jgi:5-methyltetrahydrofolate--homocysteine methyltransferase